MIPSRPGPVIRWHEIAASRDVAGIPDLLADDVVFRSPAVHAPQVGRELTTAYLTAAVAVLGPTLTYHREMFADSTAVLEFTATLDGLDVQGIDLLSWNPVGQLVEFTVMVRPVKALHKLIELMAAELGAGTG